MGNRFDDHVLVEVVQIVERIGFLQQCLGHALHRVSCCPVVLIRRALPGPGGEEGTYQCLPQLVDARRRTGFGNDAMRTAGQRDRLQVELLLGAEVVAHQRGVHPGRAGDGSHAHRLVVHLLKEAACRGEDCRACRSSIGAGASSWPSWQMIRRASAASRCR